MPTIDEIEKSQKEARRTQPPVTPADLAKASEFKLTDGLKRAVIIPEAWADLDGVHFKPKPPVTQTDYNGIKMSLVRDLIDASCVPAEFFIIPKSPAFPEDYLKPKPPTLKERFKQFLIDQIEKL